MMCGMSAINRIGLQTMTLLGSTRRMRNCTDINIYISYHSFQSVVSEMAIGRNEEDIPYYGPRCTGVECQCLIPSF